MLMTTQAANATALKMKAMMGNPVGFDPLTILTIIEVIVKLVQFWHECALKLGTPKHMMMLGGSIFDERLRRHAVIALKKRGLDVNMAHDVVAAAKVQMAEMSDEDINAIIAENTK